MEGLTFQRLAEEQRVVAEIRSEVLGQVVLVVDRLDRADRLARAAVHALVRMDVEAATTFVDAVHGALVNAGPVHHVDTGLSDHVGHGYSLHNKDLYKLGEDPYGRRRARRTPLEQA